LCESLTVFENTALGREAGIAGASVFAQVIAGRDERREVRGLAMSALRLCGLEELADVQAGALSSGQRRLVELARCVAGGFGLLLLDEPSAGLDREETLRFAEVLRTVVEDRGAGILLVEHDMSLVMSVCSYVYVLDTGRLVFDGAPAAVTASDVVRSAYLGETYSHAGAGVPD
jgi:ABC-type branched-subunit amino acid transport system ATPase component